MNQHDFMGRTILVCIVILTQAFHGESRTFFGHEPDFHQENLIQNAEFDDGVEGWINSGQAESTVVNSTDCYSGDNCVRISNRDRIICGLRYPIAGARLSPNTHYWVSMFIKLINSPADLEPFSVKLLLRNSSSKGRDHDSFYPMMKTTLMKSEDFDWFYLGGHFTTPDDVSDIEDYQVFPTPPVDVDYLLDAVSVTKVHEPNWRDRADNGIRQSRMGTITVEGNIPSCYNRDLVNIHVTQKGRDFPIGAGLRADLIDDVSSKVPDDYVTRFRKYFLERFNWAYLDKAVDWEDMEGQHMVKDDSKFEVVDRALDWMSNNGIQFRGGPLVENDKSDIPNWVKKLDDHEFTSAVKRRVGYMLDHYQNRFAHFDVSKNQASDNFLQTQSGNTDLMLELYRFAFNSLQQPTKFFTNDFNVFTSSENTAIAYNNAILLKKFHLLGGIGLQGHFFSKHGSLLDDIPLIMRRLDILRSVGSDLWISELSVNTADMADRAQFLDDILHVLYGTPEIQGILMAPYDSFRAHCHPDGSNHCVLTEDLQNNEAGERLDQFLHSDFLTQEIYSPTAAHFSHTISAFHGMYDVELTYDGHLEDVATVTHDAIVTVDFICPETDDGVFANLV